MEFTTILKIIGFSVLCAIGYCAIIIISEKNVMKAKDANNYKKSGSLKIHKRSDRFNHEETKKV